MSMKSFLIFPQTRKVLSQTEQAEEEDTDLACQKSPQISFNPKYWNQQEYACNPDPKAGSVDAEGKLRPSGSVDDADQGIVGIQEGTHPCKSDDIIAGHRAVEQDISDPLAEAQKRHTADTSKKDTGGSHLLNQLRHLPAVVKSLYLGHSRKEHGRYGVRDCRRKLRILKK